MVRRLAPALLSFALAAAACRDDGAEGDGGASAPDPATAEHDETRSESEQAPEEVTDPRPPEPPPAPPEPPSADRDVEEMTEAELEAACFDGLQAACDRLGH